MKRIVVVMYNGSLRQKSAMYNVASKTVMMKVRVLMFLR